MSFYWKQGEVEIAFYNWRAVSILFSRLYQENKMWEKKT
jgi:hypothetical protein